MKPKAKTTPLLVNVTRARRHRVTLRTQSPSRCGSGRSAKGDATTGDEPEARRSVVGVARARARGTSRWPGLDEGLQLRSPAGRSRDVRYRIELPRRAERGAARGGDDARRARCSSSPARAAARRGRSSTAWRGSSSRASARPRSFCSRSRARLPRRCCGRAAALVGASCEHVSGGTFHSFANVVLRRPAAAPSGLAPNFTILDRSDAEDVREPAARAAPGSTRRTAGSRARARSSRSSAWPSTGATTVPELIEDSVRSLLTTTWTTLVRLEDEYARLQARAEPRRLRRPPRAPPRPAARPPRRRRAALAHLPLRHGRRVPGHEPAPGGDRAQARGRRTHNVMAVGDDSQSIYSFRGADFRNIMDFASLFPGTRLIKLEENYRSTQPILEPRRTRSSTAPRRSTRRSCARARERTQRADARPVRRRARRSRASSRSASSSCARRACRSTTIAVLFRSSFHSFDLELELQRARHPVREARRLQVHRDRAREGRARASPGRSRIRATPCRGTASSCSWTASARETADDLFAHVGARRRPGRRGRADWRRTRAAAHTRRTSARLADAAREVAIGATLPVAGRRSRRVVGFYAPMLRHIHPRTSRSARRTSSTSSRSRRATGASVAALATWRSSRRPTASATCSPPRLDEGLLTLSTIHSAKGLEWQAVFVIWLVDGRFPSLLQPARRGGGRGGAAAPSTSRSRGRRSTST